PGQGCADLRNQADDVAIGRGFVQRAQGRTQLMVSAGTKPREGVVHARRDRKFGQVEFEQQGRSVTRQGHSLTVMARSDRWTSRSLGRCLLLERERYRVDAVAQIGGSAVTLAFEHVAQMAVAVGANDLDAPHPEAAVDPLDDPVARKGCEEARPAAMRIELRLAAEQFGATSAAAIHPDSLVVGVLAGERSLGGSSPEHRVLLGRQLGAPLLIGLDYVGSVGLRHDVAGTWRDSDVTRRRQVCSSRRGRDDQSSKMPITPKAIASAKPARMSHTTTTAAVRRGPDSRLRPALKAAMFCSSPSAVFGLAVRPQAKSGSGIRRGSSGSSWIHSSVRTIPA